MKIQYLSRCRETKANASMPKCKPSIFSLFLTSYIKLNNIWTLILDSLYTLNKIASARTASKVPERFY